MKILIADDEEIERTAVRDILREQPGIEVFEAKDGQDALDMLCDGLRPELCLIDVRMPVMDGVELLRRIRRDPLLRHLKVVIASANRDRNIILTLAQLSISGYLLKPYDPAKVKSVLAPLIQAAMAEKDPLPHTRNLLSNTLLVVDDDRDVRELLKTVAKTEESWDVVEARNGEEALVFLKEGLLPKLCFSDLMMPKMDGISFIKQVRDIPELQSMPIVVISSEHKTQTIRQLSDFKIAGFILKPIEAPKVKAFLRQVAGLAKTEEKTALETPPDTVAGSGENPPAN